MLSGVRFGFGSVFPRRSFSLLAKAVLKSRLCSDLHSLCLWQRFFGQIKKLSSQIRDESCKLPRYHSCSDQNDPPSPHLNLKISNAYLCNGRTRSNLLQKVRRTAPGRVITLTQHRLSPNRRLSEGYEEVFFPIVAFLNITEL